MGINVVTCLTKVLNSLQYLDKWSLQLINKFIKTFKNCRRASTEFIGINNCMNLGFVIF